MKTFIEKEIPALLKPYNVEIQYEGFTTTHLHVMPETSKLFKQLIENNNEVEHDTSAEVTHDLEKHKSSDDIISSQHTTKEYIKNKKRSVRLQQFKNYTE